MNYLFNFLIAYLAVTLTIGAFWLLFLPLTSTKVSIDLKVSSIQWITKENNSNPLDFNVRLAGNDTTALKLDSARLVANASNINVGRLGGVEIGPGNSPDSVSVENIEFPNNSTVRLERNDVYGLNLKVSRSLAKHSDSAFSWSLIFHKRLLFDTAANREILTDSRNLPGKLSELSFEKDLKTETYTLTISHTHPWDWSDELLADSISFSESPATGEKTVSSVLSGKVNLLETNDPPIVLEKGYTLRVEFVTNTPINLSGDANSINVHLEGDAKSINCGPQILGEENDRMPARLKIYMDKKSYILFIISLLAPLFVALFIRPRKPI